MSRQLISVSVGIVLWTMWGPLGIFAQGQEGPAVQIRSDLVIVPTSVLDRDSRHIGGLTGKNFSLFENDVEQKIEFFDASNLPVTVILLLDRSGSMTYHYQEMADAASVFVKQLNPNDQLMAATFADDIDVILKTTPVSDVGKGIRLRKHVDDHATLIFDAVDFALKKMRKIRGRKAIVVFSDGLGSDLLASAKSNFEDAEESDATIYTVRFDTSIVTSKFADPNEHEKRVFAANDYMIKLATKTGGRSFQIEEISGLEEAFQDIAVELSRQYTIGYYPTTTGKDGERRTIRVEVNVPNAVVQSRKEVVFKKSN